MMDTLLQDVRYGARRLQSTPGFTLAVALTLAAGIGGAAATFSVVDAAVLRALPFPDPDRLVRLREVTPQGEPFPVSEPDYLDFARRLRTLSATAAIKPLQLTMTGAGDAVRLEGAAVTSAVFPLLGVRPIEGRAFGPDDDREARPPAAIISHAMWAQRFGSDPAAVGKVVQLDGRPTTIVGVLPATAAFPPADVWIPLAPSAQSDRTDKWLDVIGRIAPDASLQAVRDDAASVASGLAREYPEHQGWSARVEPIEDWLVGSGLRRMVWVLFGAVGALLALACANIAGLLMSRGAARRTEMAVRAALGAARGRLVRQLATESLLLGLLGGALGLLAAAWILVALSALLADLLPLGRAAHLDGRAIAVTGAIMLASTFGFGLLPALQGARADVPPALRAAGRRSTPSARRWTSALVALQVALAMVLLVGAFLLVGSFVRLSRVETGFDAANVLAVPVSLPERRYVEQARPVFFDTAIARLSSVPDVESVAATATNPFRQWGYANTVTPADRAATAPAGGLLQAGWRSVTPGFFETLAVPLVAGRPFTSADRDGAPGVVVISRSLGERLWPGRSAIGQELYWGGVGGRTRTVVGVVGDVRDVRLDAPVTPMLYLPYAQLPLENMTLLVRTRRGAAGVPDAIRRELRAVDAALPLDDIRPLEANRSAAISAPRFRTAMIAVFGTVALLLASLGLYGIVAFTVAQRTREIAIRIALGAQPSQVTQLFFRRGLLVAAAGAAAGLFLAWALAGVLQSLLFETDPRDPRLFASAAVLLFAVTVLASYMPARQAAALDPLQGLTRE